ncbi:MULTISPECIES: AAA family ATPase [Serratia]|uniref:AAA family ATPase n=1 Tax=Serratia marcescens TaxID=615 RepID=A0A5C7CHJ2_SERMA|nr:ATP-binding protein [Serratia marcescens]ANM78634.1 P-loop containing region of AAA domain protein [Serratia marcescens]MDP8742222.1 AAA family ATPase [Serratia marcescens]TXE35333.1 AAA family ATPase [Serratia marcescens]TXE67935.1 AAA family ATPase [Serratia marcescens]BEL97156.1 chromosome segregation protein SMC [Serratia marcescens]
MNITHLKLRNWRNFRELDMPLKETTWLLGPNASGKSNLLDVFRFLRDICKAQGGGLQKAIAERGGIPKLRCLHARRPPEVRIDISLSENIDDLVPTWRYVLSFMPEGKGAQRTLIKEEQVFHKGKRIVNRPTAADEKDKVRLTQTYLEQIQTNADFREISDYLSNTTYLHLVPQLLKFGDLIGGKIIEDDPFGQGFLERLAKTTPRTRDSRLRKIESALSLAVPQFKQLRFSQDSITGRPHLEALYTHHRPNAGWQREEHFSDGTLRLLGLFWSILDGNSLLLLEEPELSLNDAIVREIPAILQRMQKDKKRKRQLIISTHSEALLSNQGIDASGVMILEPSAEGTSIRQLNPTEKDAIKSGFSVAEVVLPKTRPQFAEQLGLW